MHRRTPLKERRVMQDTSPAASHPRPEPIAGRDADGVAWAEVTWFEDSGEQPSDLPLIALTPIEDSS
jgi:hypothetical protein